MSDLWHTFEILFWKGASVLCKQQGALVCRSLLHKKFHKSDESFMSHFYEFWGYLVKVFKWWEKMDVIRDFFINYQKQTDQF